MPFWTTQTDTNGAHFWTQWERDLVDPTDLVWHGAVTDAGFAVVAEPASAGDLRLEVSGASDFSNIVYSETLAGAKSDPVRWDVTGLSAQTDYWWRVVGDTTTTSGSVTTFPTEGQAASLEIVAASCGNNNSSGVDSGNPDLSNAHTYEFVESRDPDLFQHLGDIHYQDLSSTSPDDHVAGMRTLMGMSRQRSLYRNVPFAHETDDHEWGPNNTDTTKDGRDAFHKAYRRMMPHYSLPEGDGDNNAQAIYYDYKIGRVRMVMLDQRRDREATSTNDTNHLSAAQMSWIKSVLDDVEANPGGNALVVINTGVPWIDHATNDTDACGGETTSNTETADTWYGARGQRDEIANAIQSRGLSGKVLFIHGDMHRLAIDSGCNNQYGTDWPDGPPVFCMGPLENDYNQKGGPYSEGHFATTEMQYGVIEVTDTGGESVDVNLRGMAVQEDGSSESEVVSHSFTATAEVGVPQKRHAMLMMM